MTAEVLDPRHPVPATVASVRADLAAMVGTPVWSMTAAETESTLLEVARLESQAAQLKLRLLAHAERVEVGVDVGATSAANWFAHESRTTRPAAHRVARLAKRLEEAHGVIDTALAEAAINLDQAIVIVNAVDDLPDKVNDSVREQAEAFLLREAADHDARALRILGRRLCEVIDPETAEAEEARRLADEEAAARAAASFTMAEDGQGKCHGRFTIPALHGTMLRKALLALAAPSRHPDRDPGMPTKHRLGEAFMEYLETRPESTLPDAGGISATVVVTMDLETLMGGLKSAGLCDGTRISAGEARRLACTAGIIPVVLGGRSEPLDVGRRRRFHTRAQRVALGLRDGGCTATGCDRPAAMCHAHHDQPWSQGGKTDVKTGRLLCPRHHTIGHDQRYESTPTPEGKINFHRRC